MPESPHNLISQTQQTTYWYDGSASYVVRRLDLVEI